jgi:hypothetical protein
MKKLIAMLAMTSALVTPAMADGTFYKNGYWSAYKTIIADKGKDNGMVSCGVQTSGSNPQGEEMALTIKNIKGEDGLLFLMSKTGWKFPAKGVKVPLKIWFDDKKGVINADAGGYGSGYDARISFVFTGGPEDEEYLLEQFSEADIMWVQFQSGNEAPWKIHMDGSRGAVNAYRGCVAQIGAEHRVAPTQPYGETTTVPNKAIEESF